MARTLCGLLLAAAFLALMPVPVLAEGEQPRRLFAEPSGVKTKKPAAGDAGKPAQNFVLGFQPGITVTGKPAINPDPAFVMKVKDKWPDCNLEKICGDVIYLDCGSEYDGPAYYASGVSLEIISTCGGACMNPSNPCNCPPKEWTCN